MPKWRTNAQKKVVFEHHFFRLSDKEASRFRDGGVSVILKHVLVADGRAKAGAKMITNVLQG